MNVALLKATSGRRRGFACWLDQNGKQVASLSAPSRNHNGWWHLKWNVDGGFRGLDLSRHRGLGKSVARDIINSTNLSNGMGPL